MPAFHQLGPVQRFIAARILPWGILAMGTLTLYLGIATMVGGWASEGWPSVPGVVANSEIETQYSNSNSTTRSNFTYHASVQYDYEVEGETYSAERVSFGEYGTGDGEYAQEVVGRYPAGAEVTVHYDPDDPARAVLEPGLHGLPWFYLLLGTPIFLFGLALQRYLSRLSRQVAGP